MKASRSLFFMLAICAAASAQAQVIPADRNTTWKPGIPGGTPVRTTVCATVQASTYGNGSQNATTGIQNAINACPAGQVVQLSAGTFTVNNYLLINKGIVLRGAGPGTTKLQKTNGAKPNQDSAADYQPIIIIGPNRWPRPDSTSVNLTSDGQRGATSVTVTNASGFQRGEFVLIDEDNYNTASWTSLPPRNGSPTSAKIWASDRAVFMRHQPSDPGDDPFPDSLGWFSRPNRPINEIKEIASVSGNTITFTGPLHISYRASKTAQITRYTENTQVQNAGIEDLTVIGGSDGNLRFEAAAYSWIKNVEDTQWLGEGVAINNSFKVVVRDSYIHHGAWPQPGGAGYAISFAAGSSDVLIENNIVYDANKMMVARSSGAGSVVGYNYLDDGHIFTDPSWVEVGINASHMVGSHHVLFEGNQSFNYDSDNTHGNAIYMTVFRNHLTGFRRTYTGTANSRAIGLMYGSWWHTVVGNVLGTSGRMSSWGYEDTGTDNGQPLIWKIGYDPQHWEQAYDPQAKNTLVRDANFDYVTNQTRWYGSVQSLPNSLYLTSKPAFFGNCTWPWVDPIGGTHLYVLPARARFDGNPNACSASTAAPSAPSNLRIVSQ